MTQICYNNMNISKLPPNRPKNTPNSKSKFRRVLKHPRLVGAALLRILAHWITNDKWYVKTRYRLYTGEKLNLDNPQTYNEKLCWQKLYDHNPLYTLLVDKYAVKEYVAEQIGRQYVIPTIAYWDNTDDIDWQSLPQQFVLKTTHDSGGVIVVKDKDKLDIEKAIKKLKKCLKADNYASTREWPYKNVPRRIIAEKYMEDTATGELRDYKFFCFDGIVKAMFVATERGIAGEDVKFDYFDSDYNHLDISQFHDSASVIPQKPICFEEMKSLASRLSKGLPQVRVDFYEVDGKIYFGELTFFHHGGIVPFKPDYWNYIFGSWIQLPN